MENMYLDTLAATLWFSEFGGCHCVHNKILREILMKVKQVHADGLGLVKDICGGLTEGSRARGWTMDC